MKPVCHHGNFLGGTCLMCLDEMRSKTGRLTLRRYELDQEYKAAHEAREKHYGEHYGQAYRVPQW